MNQPNPEMITDYYARMRAAYEVEATRAQAQNGILAAIVDVAQSNRGKRPPRGPWEAPTGPQDAFMAGDEVEFPPGSGSLWESTKNWNVLPPPGKGWKKVT